MARWWASRIAAGALHPMDGLWLIHEGATAELGHPPALRPFARIVAELVAL
ncbi:hypothetical protein ACFPM3_08335 [Streptomyces coeruleoprunus]|uniref:Uncharacterized protein n=1 Tax=Streptomyces coeruleoprunus TaxID=285563 RepID=A0ABV9X9I9_9ACTN